MAGPLLNARHRAGLLSATGNACRAWPVTDGPTPAVPEASHPDLGFPVNDGVNRHPAEAWRGDCRREEGGGEQRGAEGAASGRLSDGPVPPRKPDRPFCSSSPVRLAGGDLRPSAAKGLPRCTPDEGAHCASATVRTPRGPATPGMSEVVKISRQSAPPPEHATRTSPGRRECRIRCHTGSPRFFAIDPADGSCHDCEVDGRPRISRPGDGGPSDARAGEPSGRVSTPPAAGLV